MKNKIKYFVDLVFGKEMGVLPGNLAYSFFFAIIPILSILFYLLTSFNLSGDILSNFLNETFPKSIVDLLQPIFNSTMSLNTLITMLFGVMVATSGCYSIILASNTIYNINDGSFFRRIIKSLFMIIIIIVLIAFVLVVPLLGDAIINVIGMFTSFIKDNQTAIDILYFIIRYPLSLIIIFFIIKFIYVLAPDSRISGKCVNKGATFTTVSWLISTYVFSYYISNIANYDAIYGNLANISMLLFYLYILAYLFVLGMYLNKNDNEKAINETNTIKLEEIRKRIQEEKNKK